MHIMETILLVDDDPGIRRVYHELFDMEGYEVLEAGSAEEATEIMIRNRVNLVLLDINMPEVNGSVMREVIEEYDSKLRVIVASVYPLNEQIRRIKRADDYFDKAQSTELLLLKVKNALKIKR